MSSIVVGAPHLTIIDREFEDVRRRTFAGQASWATSADVTCRLCEHWHGCGGETGRYASPNGKGGLLKPRRCGKYQTLMNGKLGPAVPHDARACQFFRPAEKPPAVSG
jgi:hypothetical protein